MSILTTENTFFSQVANYFMGPPHSQLFSGSFHVAVMRGHPPLDISGRLDIQLSLGFERQRPEVHDEPNDLYRDT